MNLAAFTAVLFATLGSADAVQAPQNRVQLPKFFDQLELTDKQVDKMAEVARPYDEEITAKQEQLRRVSRLRVGAAGMQIGLANAITRLRNARTQKLEEVLTDDQRTKLRKLRSDK
jgi:hypothetical protein